MRDDVNPVHGAYRTPMGGAGTAFPTEAAGRRAKQAAAKHASCVERCLEDLTHRSFMERTASSLSVVSNLSSSIPTVAAFRAAYTAAAETGGSLPRPREARCERVVYRHQLQVGEKSGSAVGPNHRGTRGAIMVITDCRGLSAAVHVTSASRNEPRFVELTIERGFLPETPTRLIGDKAYYSDPLDQRARAT